MQNSLYFKIPLQAELSFEALGNFIKSLPQELKTLLFEMLKNDLLMPPTPNPNLDKEQKLRNLLSVSVWNEEDVKVFDQNQNHLNQWKIQTF